jgi:hypothetical protein
MDAKIKLHVRAADDIDFRGNPSGAKLPRLASFLHRYQAKSIAKKANKMNRKRLTKGRK